MRHRGFWPLVILSLIEAIVCALILRTAIDPDSIQCNALLAAIPGKVSYPSSTAYTSSSRSYWSSQEEALAPSCIVTPTHAKDVASIVQTLNLLNKGGLKCRFAIRGGGHTPWAGSANIDGGVTIDMRSIAEVSVDAKRSVASVGAGAIWGDVYRKMDAWNMTVVGGRGSSIGIGGLLTGGMCFVPEQLIQFEMFGLRSLTSRIGGISYFSARYGFACDNVINYQVVLASGTIVSANATSHPDLFVALKGGGNNFGVVTRFDLAAFPQGNFWGGFILYHDSTSPQLLTAFSGLDKAAGFDEYAALILSFSYVQTMDSYVASANMEYTKPEENPPAFQPFTSIQPHLQNTMRISNQTDFTTEFIQFQPNGRRQLYLTNTFKNDLTFLIDVYNMFKDTGSSALSKIPNSGLSLTIQPIPPAMTSRSASRGGNSLGLNYAEDGALVLCLISATWDHPADDTLITTTAQDLNNDIIAAAKNAGLWHRWIYLNYADGSQDPISGYGDTSAAHLRAVSRMYDPGKVFQRSVPGGFKL
ncbi:MAG: hypothetical protein Q9184_004908 [Pyrenodesmia sp. 2 TL-2023]